MDEGPLNQLPLPGFFSELQMTCAVGAAEAAVPTAKVPQARAEATRRFHVFREFMSWSRCRLDVTVALRGVAREASRCPRGAPGAQGLLLDELELIEGGPVLGIGVAVHAHLDGAGRHLDVADGVLGPARDGAGANLRRHFGPAVVLGVQTHRRLATAGAGPDAGAVGAVGHGHRLAGQLLVGRGRVVGELVAARVHRVRVDLVRQRGVVPLGVPARQVAILEARVGEQVARHRGRAPLRLLVDGGQQRGAAGGVIRDVPDHHAAAPLHGERGLRLDGGDAVVIDVADVVLVGRLRVPGDQGAIALVGRGRAAVERNAQHGLLLGEAAAEPVVQGLDGVVVRRVRLAAVVGHDVQEVHVGEGRRGDAAARVAIGDHGRGEQLAAAVHRRGQLAHQGREVVGRGARVRVLPVNVHAVQPGLVHVVHQVVDEGRARAGVGGQLLEAGVIAVIPSAHGDGDLDAPGVRCRDQRTEPAVTAARPGETALGIGDDEGVVDVGELVVLDGVHVAIPAGEIADHLGGERGLLVRGDGRLLGGIHRAGARRQRAQASSSEGQVSEGGYETGQGYVLSGCGCPGGNGFSALQGCRNRGESPDFRVTGVKK
ncbi:hypothetical protein STIAU_2498 [Stigmatella aurantiaca DW4/3-1]|uniref:Uncharacterized protein n=1 Tax=Stigmatella aurantiaca (strain DW4/3-1) TaxID=378806 RepID=Q091Y0_STIAD|nr:hypothetical protein STIAU_2498 [Stigmatella aurantiaca DW4/3-1]